MTGKELEVIDAEIVYDDAAQRLPAGVDPRGVLALGDAFRPVAGRVQYSRRDFEISDRTRQRLADSRPKNTTRNYEAAQKRFIAWCERERRVAMPCTTETFTEYVSHLIDRDYSPSQIQIDMSAVRSAHPEGMKPSTQYARLILNAYARERAPLKKTKKSAPVKDNHLAALVATCDEDIATGNRLKGLRDAALLTLAWGMLARRSEVAALRIGDLDIDDDKGVRVTVSSSKTDQAAKGEVTFVPMDPDNPATCPVRRLRAYLAALDEAGVRSGPLFRQVSRGGNLTAKSSGKGRKGRGSSGALSGAAVNEVVKARSVLAGVHLEEHERPDGKVKVTTRATAHGLRRGPAQQIADAGGDPTGQGRWKNGSRTVFEHYVQPAQGERNNPIVAMREARKAQAQQ